MVQNAERLFSTIDPLFQEWDDYLVFLILSVKKGTRMAVFAQVETSKINGWFRVRLHASTPSFNSSKAWRSHEYFVPNNSCDDGRLFQQTTTHFLFCVMRNRPVATQKMPHEAGPDFQLHDNSPDIHSCQENVSSQESSVFVCPARPDSA
jgi:hypothetical protein